jgi:hypothetical protein
LIAAPFFSRELTIDLEIDIIRSEEVCHGHDRQPSIEHEREEKKMGSDAMMRTRGRTWRSDVNSGKSFGGKHSDVVEFLAGELMFWREV